MVLLFGFRDSEIDKTKFMVLLFGFAVTEDLMNMRV